MGDPFAPLFCDVQFSEEMGRPVGARGPDPPHIPTHARGHEATDTQLPDASASQATDHLANAPPLVTGNPSTSSYTSRGCTCCFCTCEATCL